jgi:uncharacterized membrane protein
VRARLGGLVRRPRAIEVTASDGNVTLRGAILADEVDRLVKRVAAMRGVRSVDPRLDVDETGGEEDETDGAEPESEASDPSSRGWSPTTRLLAGTAGGSLALYGFRRSGLVGTTLGATGVVLLARAATNLDIPRLSGIGAGTSGVTIRRALVIDVPVADVFRFWERAENFPRFMSHVREVRRTGDGASRWTVQGPAGIPVEWDAAVTECVPNQVIAWRTEPGDGAIAHAGRVRFDGLPDGRTRLDVQMAYNPVAGGAGHVVATLLGSNPGRVIDEDLARFKALIEHGEGGRR